MGGRAGRCKIRRRAFNHSPSADSFASSIDGWHTRGHNSGGTNLHARNLIAPFSWPAAAAVASEAYVALFPASTNDIIITNLHLRNEHTGHRGRAANTTPGPLCVLSAALNFNFNFLRQLTPPRLNLNLAKRETQNAAVYTSR